MNYFMLIALIVLFTGVGFLALAGMVFHFRAIANKPAWNGMTKPFLLIGLIFLIIGLVLVYFAYKNQFGDS
ncbi:MAG TPA: hypothetical protein DEB31_06315 [Clostridiales bacterium]|nr:hypothetical protein [Clostridiales bacterium]